MPPRSLPPLPSEGTQCTSVNASQSQRTEGSSTLSSSMVNLGKAVVGAGALSLPSGIASFASSPVAVIPSIGMLLFIGSVAAYSFRSIGQICERSGARSLSEAWSKTVSGQSRFLTVAVVFNTFLTCLVYSIVIGDTFAQIFDSLGLPLFFIQRSNVIFVFSLLVLLPLSCCRRLDALKYTSMFGLVATIYCALFMIVRLLDRSYASDGRFVSDLDAELQPSFSEDVLASRSMFNVNVFSLMSMMSTSYVAHYNAPKIWTELQNASLDRFNWIVNAAFGFAAVAYVAIMSAGYLTFGEHSASFILNNYSKDDSLALVARIAIGLSIVCSYPLTFAALREGVAELLPQGREKSSAALPLFSNSFPISTPTVALNGSGGASTSNSNVSGGSGGPVGGGVGRSHVYLTVALFMMLTLMSTKVHDIGYIVSLSGSLVGSMFIYVVPAIMNICAQQRKVKGDGEVCHSPRTPSGTSLGYQSALSSLGPELVGNYAMIVCGLIVSTCGVVASIRSMQQT